MTQKEMEDRIKHLEMQVDMLCELALLELKQAVERLK